jgi:hypothetical protein
MSGYMPYQPKYHDLNDSRGVKLADGDELSKAPSAVSLWVWQGVSGAFYLDTYCEITGDRLGHVMITDKASAGALVALEEFLTLRRLAK